MQIRQSDTNGTSRPCTNQIIACSFRPIRGTVAGQHAHGFLVVYRSVELEQNAWYSNSTQKKKDFEKITSRHKKEDMSCTS